MKPFRVVCIDDADGPSDPGAPQVKLNEIYTVVDISQNPKFLGGMVYEFREFGPNWIFATICYRPVDDSFGEWVEETLLKDAILEECYQPKNAMKFDRILAWLKGQQPIGSIHNINEDCYWKDKVAGCVSTFNKIKRNDIVISPNPNQDSAHIYRVKHVVKKSREDDPDPYRAYVKLVDIIPDYKLNDFKERLIEYPYI